MARETYITKCLNWETNDTIALYESFGWELVSNNVVTSVNTDSSLNVAAENELTFSRDKDAPWYAAVNKLQQEFIGCNNQIDSINNTNPTKEMKFHWIIFIILLFFYGIGLIYLAIHFALVFMQKNKEKQWHAENDPKIASINDRRAKIIDESRALINGGN